MYIARLRLNNNWAARKWASNPYRVHQRLMMAYEGDPRLLFRIEEDSQGLQVLIQSHNPPDWTSVFDDFRILTVIPEYKPFTPDLKPGRRYHFRLLANPTVKKTVEINGGKRKQRQGLLYEKDQIAWLERKLEKSGARLVECLIVKQEMVYSRKNPGKEDSEQAHLAVLYEGVLEIMDADLLVEGIGTGFGSAKGYGFGLLSLAPA
jgi:CRISPR system Cascade subunit CasE